MTQRIVTELKAVGSEYLKDLFAGDQALDPADIATAETPGWFTNQDPIWTVNSDPSLLIGGIASLFIQTLHPLVMAGVADHSDYETDTLGRLHRTGRFIAATTFAKEEIAQQSVDIVNKIHLKINGQAPDGRTYSATTSDLLNWVHVTETYCFISAYQKFGPKKISDTDADLYVQQMGMISSKLGVQDPAQSMPEITAQLNQFESECEYKEQAKETIKFLINPQVVPKPLKPAYALVVVSALSLLPLWARKLMLVPLPPLITPIGVYPAAKILSSALRWFQVHPSKQIVD